jgi:hypothetical protein
MTKILVRETLLVKLVPEKKEKPPRRPLLDDPEPELLKDAGWTFADAGTGDAQVPVQQLAPPPPPRYSHHDQIWCAIYLHFCFSS